VSAPFPYPDRTPLGPVTTVLEATGTPQLHRDAIIDSVNRAAIYAQQAIELAQLSDDRGLSRAVRMMALCAVYAAEILPRLTQAADSEKRLIAAARVAAGVSDA
jgi:hypothetical protein